MAIAFTAWMICGGTCNAASLNCDKIEANYKSCTKAGLDAFENSGSGFSDFSYIAKCGAQRREALIACEKTTNQKNPSTEARRTGAWQAVQLSPTTNARGDMRARENPPVMTTCSEVNRWMQLRVQIPSGPGVCTKQVNAYLTNTLDVRVVCRLDFERSSRTWSSLQTGVPPKATIGGEQQGIMTCDGTGNVRFNCFVQPQASHDFDCRN